MKKPSSELSVRPLLRQTTFVFVACLGIWIPRSHGEVLVDLDATQLSEGPLANWRNTGSLGGDFAAPAGAAASVAAVQGVKGVSLNGTSHYYTGPAAPESVTGSNPRTIEAWLHNPAAADEETIFAWGRRGGPDGSNISFNHGGNALFGAVGHWGAPDMGWDGKMATARWTYAVYTYDGTTAAVYFDGTLATSKEVALDTWAIDNTDPGAPLPFRVGSQSDANGVATGGLRGSMTIAKIRVHDQALDAAAIKANFDSTAGSFGLGDQDNDLLPSWYENLHAFLNPSDPTDAAKDQDNDGLTNLEEFNAGTLPDNPDTDGDGLTDGAEMKRVAGGAAAPTNPLRKDSDGDGLADGAENGSGTFVSAANTGSDPLKADSDGDGFDDYLEVLRGSNPNQASSVPNAADAPALVNLDATVLDPGPAAAWENKGALGGVFAAPAGAPPRVTAVQGVRAISFNGSSHFLTGPAAPSFLTGNASRTVEAWVHNPAVAGEETIFAWGRRGGPEGSNTSFNHGSNEAFGAVGHWGSPDIGWNGEVATGQWTYLVYTYDGPTQTTVVYKDGVEANREELPNPLNTWAVDNTAAGNPLPMRVASQNEANGTATGGLRGSMSIAKIRVYDRVLGALAIAANYSAEANAFGVIDTDNDGLPTWYERQYNFLSPTDATDAARDQDGDGLTNAAEFQAGTAPDNADTDGDGVSDGAEVNRVAGATNPLNRDTDQDGLTDRVETGAGTFVGAENTGSDPLAADTDQDGFADGQEVFHGANPVLSSSTPVFSTPVALVNLDATGAPLGPMTRWENSGAIGGVFGAGEDNAGAVETVQGVKGVTLDGVDDFYTGPSAPIFLAGNGSRTVDAWIFNPAIGGEETVFAWGRRGGPDGSNASFIHGSNATFGAIGGWGAGPDVGWNGQLAAGQWTHLAYAYDGASMTARVYKDGALANTEVFTAPLAVWTTDNSGEPGRALPFRVGIQNTADGGVGGQFGSMTVARIRVYDQSLTAEQVQARFDAEKGAFAGAPEELKIENAVYNPATGAISFTWKSVAGKTYEVQASSDLKGWTTAAAGVTTGSYSEVISAANAPRFFRLRMQ